MKNLLLIVACSFVLLGCGPSAKERAAEIRQSVACAELLTEIEGRDDVAKAIITDGCGLSVAMWESINNPEIVAAYFIRAAHNKGVEVEFCKIVSAYDYKWGDGL